MCACCNKKHGYIDNFCCIVSSTDIKQSSDFDTSWTPINYVFRYLRLNIILVILFLMFQRKSPISCSGNIKIGCIYLVFTFLYISVIPPTTFARESIAEINANNLELQQNISNSK